MEFLVLCDYRENFKNYSTMSADELYSDHPNKKNISEIIDAIKTLNYKCEYFGGIPELIHSIDKHMSFKDCIFLNFTDGMDENYSRVQAPALLDILKVPYSGSGVFASVLMNNKHFCKQALKDTYIIMPKSCIVTHKIPINIKELANWKFPLFVKPNCEGSSLGISQKNVCHTVDDIENICQKLLEDFDEIIVEEYIPGIDVTNYLIGNEDSYVINDVIISELLNKSPYAVYGINEKQNKLRNLFLNDEYFPIEVIKKIQNQSILIAKTIGAKDICRIDYRVNLTTHEINFIEINSAPRFSKTSEIGFIAQKNNITFLEMVQFYIDTVLKRIV